MKQNDQFKSNGDRKKVSPYALLSTQAQAIAASAADTAPAVLPTPLGCSSLSPSAPPAADPNRAPRAPLKELVLPPRVCAF